MNARAHRSVLSVALALAAFALGCDPKLVGIESAGTGGGGTGIEDGPDPVVTPEALIVGNIVAFHSDLTATCLPMAATFDSASVPLRSFDTGCASVEELAQPSDAHYEVLFDGCVDGHGTSYRGGGRLWVIRDQNQNPLDGFTFLPLFEENLLRAINETDDNFNHTMLFPASTAGSLEFTFERDELGAVEAVRVGKFLRHGVRGEVVTISYADVLYSGAVSNLGTLPDEGSTVRVVWDGVGLFDVVLHDDGTATYSMQANDYTVNLSSGDVSLVPQ